MSAVDDLAGQIVQALARIATRFRLTGNEFECELGAHAPRDLAEHLIAAGWVQQVDHQRLAADLLAQEARIDELTGERERAITWAVRLEQELAQATAFELVANGIPEGHELRRHFSVAVERRGPGSWAVTDRFGECYGRNGRWTWESLPSSRTEEFIAAHRFPLDEALELAREAVEKIRFGPSDGGMDAAQAMEWHAQAVAP